VHGACGLPVRLRPRSTAPAMSRTTRSSCGALSSIPPTHQNNPARIAASLARERTKPGEVALEGLLLLAVGGEVAAPQRGLRVRVVIRRGPDELRDRRGRGGARRRGRGTRPGRRGRGWPGLRDDRRAPEQRVQ